MERTSKAATRNSCSEESLLEQGQKYFHLTKASHWELTLLSVRLLCSSRQNQKTWTVHLSPNTSSTSTSLNTHSAFLPPQDGFQTQVRQQTFIMSVASFKKPRMV